jgi:hypothetical protein
VAFAIFISAFRSCMPTILAVPNRTHPAIAYPVEHRPTQAHPLLSPKRANVKHKTQKTTKERKRGKNSLTSFQLEGVETEPPSIIITKQKDTSPERKQFHLDTMNNGPVRFLRSDLRQAPAAAAPLWDARLSRCRSSSDKATTTNTVQYSTVERCRFK